MSIVYGTEDYWTQIKERWAWVKLNFPGIKGHKLMPINFNIINSYYAVTKVDSISEYFVVGQINNGGQKYEYDLDDMNDFYEEKQTMQCICSQYIKIKYLVKNRENNNTLLIGSCCIHKYGSKEMKDQIKEDEKQERKWLKECKIEDAKPLHNCWRCKVWIRVTEGDVGQFYCDNCCPTHKRCPICNIRNMKIDNIWPQCYNCKNKKKK